MAEYGREAAQRTVSYRPREPLAHCGLPLQGTVVESARDDLGGLLHSLPMHPDLKTLDHLKDLDRILEASAEAPVLLFKHSYSCGVSAEALDELVSHLNDREHRLTVAMVTVQTHRDVSNAVSSRLGIRHETPQALLIRNGRVVWSASHFRVTSRSVQQAIDSHLAS